MKRILFYLMLLSAVSFVTGCDKDEEQEKIVEKTIIKIGDTIDKVKEVYGDADVIGNFFLEEGGQTIQGHMWWYMDLELKFIFDESSPRLVIYIDGVQGG